MATCPDCERRDGDDVTSCSVDGATLRPDATWGVATAATFSGAAALVGPGVVGAVAEVKF